MSPATPFTRCTGGEAPPRYDAPLGGRNEPEPVLRTCGEAQQRRDDALGRRHEPEPVPRTGGEVQQRRDDALSRRNEPGPLLWAGSDRQQRRDDALSRRNEPEPVLWAGGDRQQRRDDALSRRNEPEPVLWAGGDRQQRRDDALRCRNEPEPVLWAGGDWQQRRDDALRCRNEPEPVLRTGGEAADQCDDRLEPRRGPEPTLRVEAPPLRAAQLGRWLARGPVLRTGGEAPPRHDAVLCRQLAPWPTFRTALEVAHQPASLPGWGAARARRVLRTPLLVVLALGVARCAPSDVVVADLPPLDDGGRPQRELPCATSADCTRPQDFCEKVTCDDQVGRCHPRPVFCSDDTATSCGCNGVNYWNDCLRRQAGQPAGTGVDCTAAATCSSTTACPDSAASCARLLPDSASCAPEVSGTCWVLPPSCPGGSGAGGAWQSCAGAACVDVCVAIRAQSPHWRANTCP